MKSGIKVLIAGGLLVCAICTVGMTVLEDRPEAVLVEEVYVVKPGDTLWNISERYLAKNTGTVRSSLNTRRVCTKTIRGS